MRRLRNFTLNFALVALSLAATDLFFQACDWAAGVYLPRVILPHHLGLLFDPGLESHAKMHDYECHESINSLGFRGSEVSLEKTHKYRIVAIGDSFTYGWGVDLEDTWCKRLESNLCEQGFDVEILNLGLPASGPQEYAQIASVAVPLLKPDLVILGILNGDDLQQCFSPILMVRNHYVNIIRMIRYCQALRAKNPGTPPKKNPEEMRAWFASAAKDILGGMNRKIRARYEALEPEVKKAFEEGTLNPWLISHSTGEPDYFMNTVDIKRLRLPIYMMSGYLKQARKAAESSHARIVALSIPEGFYVNKEAHRNVQRIGFEAAPEMLTSHVVDEAVKTACDRAGVPFHGALDAMRQHAGEPGLYFELDRHFSPKGNALYADIVTPFVAQEIAALGKGER